MTKRILFLLFTLGIAFSPLTTASNSFRPPINWNQAEYRIIVNAPLNYKAVRQHLSWLRQNDYDIAGINWQTGQIEVITNEQGLERIKQYRISYTILKSKKVGQEDTEKLDQRYLNPQKVEEKLKLLSQKYPQYTRLEQIGTSNEGRAIWALLLSTTPKKGDSNYYNKPTIIFDGMHHAREVMSSEVVMDVADVVLGLKRSATPWNQIMDGWNIWIVPMLNVDGNNIVWTQDKWWRKNARGDGKKVYGVDINRNYPFLWNTCGGSSGSKSSQTYRGDKAGSEPETQALAKLGYEAFPTASLSYHSYSELVLYPYGCDGSLTSESALFQKIANELASHLPKDNGRGNYAAGSPWQLLYSVDGDSMSFMHSEFGALAFTFEVNQSFQPDYELRAPTLLKHRDAWSFFLQRSSQNMLSLKVTAGRRSVANAATVAISTISNKLGEKPFHTNPGGNFFKVLDPGAYNVTVTLADGRSKSFQIQMQGQPQAQIVEF
ncbi:MAG: hypothetical protein KDD45_10260 [Bdellovibrionales bacterium]|nr:hypothetical protein [Bdellovibrionales bacterium]